MAEVETPEPSDPTAPETPAAAPGTSPGEPPAPPAEESFINPNELPAELRPHWKKMHRSYTKALERTKEAASKAALVDRFYGDPAFAEQTIQQWAAQRGYQLTRAQAAAVAQQAQAATDPAPGELPPELAWLQPILDRYIDRRVAPVQQRLQSDTRDRRTGEYQQLAEQLSEAAPGWETHEPDMIELLDYLQGDKFTHPRFGSKLALLHNLVTGQAVATAARRMGEAAKSRAPTGTSGRTVESNLEERIRTAPNNRAAWDLAKREILAKQGAGR